MVRVCRLGVSILLAIRGDGAASVVVARILITRVFLVFENAMLLSTELITIKRTSSGELGFFGFSGATPKRLKSCVLIWLDSRGSRKSGLKAALLVRSSASTSLLTSSRERKTSSSVLIPVSVIGPFGMRLSMSVSILSGWCSFNAIFAVAVYSER